MFSSGLPNHLHLGRASHVQFKSSQPSSFWASQPCPVQVFPAIFILGEPAMSSPGLPSHLHLGRASHVHSRYFQPYSSWASQPCSVQVFPAIFILGEPAMSNPGLPSHLHLGRASHVHSRSSQPSSFLLQRFFSRCSQPPYESSWSITGGFHHHQVVDDQKKYCIPVLPQSLHGTIRSVVRSASRRTG